jgi:hypothetical protein
MMNADVALSRKLYAEMDRRVGFDHLLSTILLGRADGDYRAAFDLADELLRKAALEEDVEATVAYSRALRFMRERGWDVRG